MANGVHGQDMESKWGRWDGWHAHSRLCAVGGPWRGDAGLGVTLAAELEPL